MERCVGPDLTSATNVLQPYVKSLVDDYVDADVDDYDDDGYCIIIMSSSSTRQCIIIILLVAVSRGAMLEQQERAEWLRV